MNVHNQQQQQQQRIKTQPASNQEPAGMLIPSARQLLRDLHTQLPQCQMRGLSASASWLAELAESCIAAAPAELMAADEATEDAANDAVVRTACELITGLGPQGYTRYCLVKSYLDRGEYLRACSVAQQPLQSLLGGKPASAATAARHPLMYFVYLFAKYRSAEKRRLDDEAELRWLQQAPSAASGSATSGGGGSGGGGTGTAGAGATAAAGGGTGGAAGTSAGGSASVGATPGGGGGCGVGGAGCGTASAASRNDLIEAKRELEIAIRRGSPVLDGYCYYMYALVLKALGYLDQASDNLVTSLRLEPALWPAWAMLADLVRSRQELESLALPRHWMRQFFLATAYARLHESLKAEAVIQELLEVKCLAGSAYLLTQLAIVKDQQRAVGEAKLIFKQLFDTDRYALDAADVYSNLLYVEGNHSLLADLAHHCVLVDKYKPVTCCVVGNYYGLRGSHDKALSYFQRALRLRPDYALVWILVGHEYLELKQVSNAVQAYHKAVTFNPADYRGWYGLGHVHEMNGKPYYAIYYFRECQRLWSTDPRVMVALGDCYNKVGRNEEAKKCFLKAFHVGDPDTMALLRLAELYEKLHEPDNACNAYLVLLSTVIKSGSTDPKAEPAAYKFLANYYMDQRQLEEASKAAKMCLDYPETKEFGKYMLKQIGLRCADTAAAATAAATAAAPAVYTAARCTSWEKSNY